jgi:hypothetical protein
VDNEDQNFIPNVLLCLLEHIWENLDGWYFAVDMGVYHTTGLNPKAPVVPDVFCVWEWNAAKVENRLRAM